MSFVFLFSVLFSWASPRHAIYIIKAGILLKVHGNWDYKISWFWCEKFLEFEESSRKLMGNAADEKNCTDCNILFFSFYSKIILLDSTNFLNSAPLTMALSPVWRLVVLPKLCTCVLVLGFYVILTYPISDTLRQVHAATFTSTPIWAGTHICKQNLCFQSMFIVSKYI